MPTPTYRPVWPVPTTFDDILARVQRDTEIYNGLTPAERAEVDAFNASISGKSIVEIIEITEQQPDGMHPFVKYRRRAMGE